MSQWLQDTQMEWIYKVGKCLLCQKLNKGGNNVTEMLPKCYSILELEIELDIELELDSFGEKNE